MEGKVSTSMLPEKMMAGVTKTLSNIKELESHFDEFMSLMSDPNVVAQLSPLDRAQSLLSLSKLTSTLLSVRLRCSGVYPDHHPVKGEIDRLGRYQEKLERSVEQSKAPLRPSTMLNQRAATRFIEHSLPDLTPAKEFLEKAARELIGESNGAVKGPLGPVQSVDIDKN
ncbi:hypothetical protein KSS87_022293 [Heliosperma pusillum]|nr:hypothetical protein KSS87_022293 [Heliosperma pusillum]